MHPVIISSGLLFGVWLLLSGHYTPLLLGLGGLSAVGVSLVAARMKLLDDEGLPMGILIRLPRIIIWLIIEILKADWAVIKIILVPERAKPRFVVVDSTHKSVAALVTYGNFITLTPGTVTVDVDETKRQLLVHAIDDEFADARNFARFSAQIQRLEAP